MRKRYEDWEALTGIHDTIEIDPVAMSVNDILTSGAKALFGNSNAGCGLFICLLLIKVLEKSGLSLNEQLPRNDGMTTTVGEALMAPTVIYVKQG
ncbi:hypothetical protein GUJ93_ZPchr0013g35971 [Zizania palustris]|uniref:Uncharacterized protein n=1 Tax=Zizania palustris TaxID=103762 RepID=A0A8J5X064_ZIZPA|nr:hypothetical protein GUJ93_ZPchr0013g35971 [Zizania palustris]